MNQKVLLVEDDPKLGQQVADHLESAGLRVRWIRDGDEALLEPGRDYALIILDLMLPGRYGLDLLKHFREANDVPVLILSARNDTSDKVRAFKLGADDYITKPFWPEELVARVQARLRRPVLARSDVIEDGDLKVDLSARRVLVKEVPVDLTRVEFNLLAILARRPGAAVSRGHLVDEALDPEREGTDRTLDVHVSRLRKKLGACGKSIATVWGVGYRLELQNG